MDRTEFEKIVGGESLRFFIDEKTIHFINDNVVLIDSGGHVVQLNLRKTTPDKLRHCLYSIGIKCDWDEPVTFERLMELDGAISDRNNTQVIFVLGRLPSLRFAYSATLNSWVDRDTGRDITTMKQVHILLEAAGVGR